MLHKDHYIKFQKNTWSLLCITENNNFDFKFSFSRKGYIYIYIFVNVRKNALNKEVVLGILFLISDQTGFPCFNKKIL